MVIACAALQMCATFLAFGGLWLVLCSKRGEYVSRWDGCGWFGAPNVRNFSRVWMVVAGLALQMCATFLAFGGLLPVLRSKRGEFVSCLEGCGWFGAPNAGNSSRVWRVS